MAGRRQDVHSRWRRISKKCWPRTTPDLLIGDPALQIDRSRFLTLDLAEEWIRYTGKPFVFAFWAVRAAS
jgi:predicted solute-binding protein